MGWLGTTAQALKEPYAQAFVDRLRELGYEERRNLVVHRRHAGGRIEQLSAAAAELAALDCDVLYGSGPRASLDALQQASRDKPIVFVAVDFDPIATGHVASLARPGGRVTGVSAVQSQLPAKRLELLKEMLPGTRTVTVFANNQTTQQLEVAQAAVARLGIALHVIHFAKPPFDYEAAFADAVRAKSDALFALGSALFVPARRKIPALALQARLPSVFHHSQWAQVGGLMSYGFNFAGMWRTGAEKVAKILAGAKVGDIPIEQPSTYELAINLTTAKALGVVLPRSFQLRVNLFFE